MNLNPKEVYITSFLQEYLLPTVIIYKRLTDTLQQIRIFKCQSGMAVENVALLLKQLWLSLGGMAYD